MNATIAALKEKLRRQGGPQPRPASAKDLKQAAALGFPAELLEFYLQCEPKDWIELQQRIWSIENAVVENTNAVPGCALSPHGYVVFASTLCGDAYCIDTNVTTPQGHHPVVLFSHEVIDEDSTLDKIHALRVEVASSLEDFLVQFTNGALSEEPSYGG